MKTVSKGSIKKVPKTPGETLAGTPPSQEKPTEHDHALESGTALAADSSVAAISEGVALTTAMYLPPTVEQLTTAYNSPASIESLESAPYEVQVVAIIKQPSLIVTLPNASENLKAVAIACEPALIEQIQNPSKELQLLAVTFDENLIEVIQNPDEEGQIIAIFKAKFTEFLAETKTVTDSDFLTKIKNPTEAARLFNALINNLDISGFPNSQLKRTLIAISKKKKVFRSDMGSVENLISSLFDILFNIKFTSEYKKEEFYRALKDYDFSSDLSIRLLRIIHSHKINFTNNPTVIEQLAVVTKGANFIKLIRNPSIESKILSVSKDGMTLRYIRSEDEAVRTIAQLQTPAASAIRTKELTPQQEKKLIKHFNKHSSANFRIYEIANAILTGVIPPRQYESEIPISQAELDFFSSLKLKKEQIIFLSTDMYLTDILRSPSDRLLLAMLQRTDSVKSMTSVLEPSEKVRNKVASLDWDNNQFGIGNIDVQDEKSCLIAVRSRPTSIYYGSTHCLSVIDNPSTLVQVTAVKRDVLSIKYIANPTEEAQMAFLDFFDADIEKTGLEVEDLHLLRIYLATIKHPTERVQLRAISIDTDCIYYINNPCEKVRTVIEALKAMRPKP